MRGRKIQSQNLGAECRNFRNFGTVFGQSELNFRDCFRTSLDRIFGTVFGQSRIVLRFGFDPGTDVFGFCCVFWYHNNLLMNGTKKMVHGRECTKMCPVLYVSDI